MEPPAAPGTGDELSSRLPFAWVTWTLIASVIGVFILQLVELHRHHDDVVGDALAFSPDALQEHRYYTLLTYAWAHAVAIFGYSTWFFWLHIVANLIPLACLGPALEEILGHGRFLALYLGGAIVSVLVWYSFNSDSGESIIGASGAVFAVIGGLGAALPFERVTVLFLFVLPVRMSMGAVAFATCGIEALLILMQYIPHLAAYSMPEVAHSAHLGGAAFGAIFTLLLMRRRRS